MDKELKNRLDDFEILIGLLRRDIDKLRLDMQHLENKMEKQNGEKD